jgi:hypothetical protein
MNLIFVDVEAWGDTPRMGGMSEFGAVKYPRFNGTWLTFHGVLVPDGSPREPAGLNKYIEVFEEFTFWLAEVRDDESRLIFVSDNPAWDFQWIHDAFIYCFGSNPFGHSGRRIGDFYAGLVGRFDRSTDWKRLRVTKHDHHPVHDAIGNAEAFERMMNGER